MIYKAALALAVLALGVPYAAAQTQGVSKTEITIGSILDLSGPVAAYGKQTRAGMQLRVDELNEQGGINGRKIKLLVEDHAYDPKRAVLAGEKLVNQDKIFAMMGHIGSAHNNAVMPLQFEKNVINFFPLSSAREMYEPVHKLKWAVFPTYYDQIRTLLPKVVKEKNVKKVCIIYQDDDLGLEVLKGGEAALKAMSMDYVEKTSYKRGATDFSSQVARMKSAGCELVVMGTIIRETIGTINESKKIGFNPVMLGHNGTYTELIPKLGGPSMNGLYAAMQQQLPYLDDASPALSFWAKKYKTKFNEDPAVFSVYGYVIMDTFINVAAKAGPNLTTESFTKAMESMKVPADIFGGPEMTFSPTRHLGSELSRLSQIVDGKWKVVSDYPKP